MPLVLCSNCSVSKNEMGQWLFLTFTRAKLSGMLAIFIFVIFFDALLGKWGYWSSKFKNSKWMI